MKRCSAASQSGSAIRFFAAGALSSSLVHRLARSLLTDHANLTDSAVRSFIIRAAALSVLAAFKWVIEHRAAKTARRNAAQTDRASVN